MKECNVFGFGDLCPGEPSISRVSPALHPELCLQLHLTGSRRICHQPTPTPNCSPNSRPETRARVKNRKPLPIRSAHSQPSRPHGQGPRAGSARKSPPRPWHTLIILSPQPDDSPFAHKLLSYHNSIKSEKHPPHFCNKELGAAPHAEIRCRTCSCAGADAGRAGLTRSTLGAVGGSVTSQRGPQGVVGPAGPRAVSSSGLAAACAPGSRRRVDPKLSGSCTPFAHFRIFSECGTTVAGSTPVSTPSPGGQARPSRGSVGIERLRITPTHS